MVRPYFADGQPHLLLLLDALRFDVAARLSGIDKGIYLALRSQIEIPMKIRFTSSVSAATLLLLMGATAAQAQPAPIMKMTTDIPPGIAIPDKVETRLGTLEFFDGFPDKATVDKVYDNLDFQRAVQAYLLALAPVNMAGLREGLLGVGPANVTIPTFENNLNARSIFLTANATTPYTWIWINLHDGPLVVEVPPMTLGMIDDFWFKYVTDIGIVGPDKGQGGKYLLLPPGYKGEVPEGYTVEEFSLRRWWVPDYHNAGIGDLLTWFFTRDTWNPTGSYPQYLVTREAAAP